MDLEHLESISHINYNTPLPRPIEAALFFDLVKIRRFVDDAANLAMRASSDIASPTLTNVNSGIPSIPSSLIASGPGHVCKLSPERKLHMRRQAGQKLARAYRLNEIACSSAVMQRVEPLEEVSSLVLQRSPTDADAKYVQVFHEKVSTREAALAVSLQPLTDIIEHHPGEPELLRTRAITHLYKDDFDAALFDLTHALSAAAFIRKSRESSQQNSHAGDAQPTARRRPHDIILSDKDQPSSLEAQLYFQRATVYFTRACNHALEGIPTPPTNHNGSPDPDNETSRKQAEARKLVKTYAKRAIKDYLAFISTLHYSPNLPVKTAKEFYDRVSLIMHGARSSRAIDSHSWAESHTVYALSDLFSAVPVTNLPPYPAPDVPKHDLQASKQLRDATNTCEWVTYHPLLIDSLHCLLMSHCLAQTSAKEIQRHAYMVARLVRLSDGAPIFGGNRSIARGDWAEILYTTKNWLQMSGSWDKLCEPAPLPCFEDGPCKHGCHRRHTQALKASPAAKRAAAAAAIVRGDTFDAAAEEEKRRKAQVREQAILSTLQDEHIPEDTSSLRGLVEAQKKRAQRDKVQVSNQPSNGTPTTRIPLGPGTTVKAASAPVDAPIDPDIADLMNNQAVPLVNLDQLDALKARWAEQSKDQPSLEFITTERAYALVRWIREAPIVTGMTKRKKRTKKTAEGAEGACTKVDDASEGVEKLKI